MVESLGGLRGVTPCLDSIAADGIMFTQCYSSSFRTDRGLISILSGFPGPSLLQFLSWPDANSRDAGHAAFAADPHVREKVSREIADKGNPYYRVSRTWQFRPTSFGVPAKAFDGPAVA